MLTFFARWFYMNIDEIYQKCPHIVFLPFIGKNYGKDGSIFCNNKKLLILGERFRCDNRRCPNLKCNKEYAMEDEECYNFYTYQVRDWHIKDKKDGFRHTWMRGFLSCEKAYFNREPSHKEREEFWNSCCFYNYFTEPSKSDSKVFETQNTYKISQEAFKELINYLRPDAIICWGKETYDALPKYGHQQSSIKNNELTASVWYYPFEDGNGGVKLLCHSPHPSIGKGGSYFKWYYIYKEFLCDF